MRASSAVRRALGLPAVFIVGFGLGLWLWPRIRIPFANPWEVVGPLTLIQYNPLNNVLRFLALISLPSLLLLLSARYWKRAYPGVGSGDAVRAFEAASPTRRSPMPVVLVFSVVVLASISYPTFLSGWAFDTFHEGESLAPGDAVLQGEVPYKDVLFVHGAYEDPIRSFLAFRILGRSIGAVRTIQGLNKLVAYLLLAAVLVKLSRGRPEYSLVVLLLLLCSQGPYGAPFARPPVFRILPREMTTFAFVIVADSLFEILRQGALGGRIFLASFLLAFISVASFGYSVDKGFYLCATFTVLSLAFFVLFPRGRYARAIYLGGASLGAAAGIVLLWALLRDGFADFGRFTFLTMPRYKELMDGFVYPIETLRGLGACLLIALNTFWVCSRWVRERQTFEGSLFGAFRSFLASYGIELCLLLLSITGFRSALGRADHAHIIDSSTMSGFLSSHILARHYLPRVLPTPRAKRWSVVVAATCLAVIGAYDAHRIVAQRLIVQEFPLGIDDSAFIPAQHQATVDYLKTNLGPDESFVTMTNEASWYYFVGVPCPMRFPVVWFAAPRFYQEEIVRALDQTRVKFILYRNESRVNDLDGIDNRARLPIVFRKIEQDYVFFKRIDNNELWIRARPGRGAA